MMRRDAVALFVHDGQRRTVRRSLLTTRITTLSAAMMQRVCAALSIAVDCPR